MYERLPSAEEAVKAGFVPEDYASEPVDPYPDNLEALSLFSFLRTQWRMGPNGASGLDYAVMHHRMDRMGLRPDKYYQLEADIHVMECAALAAIHKKP